MLSGVGLIPPKKALKEAGPWYIAESVLTKEREGRPGRPRFAIATQRPMVLFPAESVYYITDVKIGRQLGYIKSFD